MQYRFGDLVVDADRFELTVGGQPTPLELGVFRVLLYLVENSGRVVSKVELLEQVWGDRFVSESTLTTRIKQARHALGDDGRNQDIIRTVRGIGYEFMPRLELIDPDGAEPAKRGGQPEAGQGSPTPGAEAAAPQPREGSPRPGLISVAQSISVDDEFPFVGRTAEFASIDTTDPEAASFRMVLLGGPPGVGKSRLAVEVLRRRTEAGWVVAAGRCTQHLTAAFQPIRDALLQLARTEGVRFAQWCAGIEDLVVDVLPTLATQLGVEGDPARPSGAAHESLLMVLDRVAEQQPLALLVDDLQWSDEPTRSLLGALARRLADRQVELYITFRTTSLDLPPDVRAWIDQAARSTAALRLDLDDLDADAVASLTSSALGDSGNPEALFRQTGGHSLFVVETLRDQQLGRPESLSVAELVAARLGLLDEPARRLVESAALLGNEFELVDAASAAKLELLDGLDAVESALGAGLLLETGSVERFRFAHQLIPDSVSAGLTGPARATIHARCASAIGDRGGDPVEVAFHRLGAAPLIPLAVAVAEARSVAGTAEQQRQFDQVERLLARVLEFDLSDRVRAEVQLEAGAALNEASRVMEAAARFEAAADLARANGWPELLADAAIGHWERSPFRNRRDRTTLALLTEAAETLDEGDVVRHSLMQAKTAAFSLFTPLAERSKLSHQALAMVPDAEPAHLLELLELHNLTHGCPAGFEELCRIEPELLRLRAEASDVVSAVPGLPEVLGYMRGDGTRLRHEASYLDGDPNDLPTFEMRRYIIGGTIAALEGDTDRARYLYDRSQPLGGPVWGDSGDILYALGQLFCDSIDGSWERSPELLEAAHRAGGNQLTTPIVAWARLAIGDETGAETVLADLKPANLAWFGDHLIGGHALVAASQLAVALDRRELADSIEAALAPLDGLMLGMPWAGSFATAHARTTLAIARNDLAAAERHRAEALAIYDRLGAPALATLVPAVS